MRHRATSLSYTFPLIWLTDELMWLFACQLELGTHFFQIKKNILRKNPICYGGRGRNINSIYKTIISGAVSNNTKTTRTHKKINYKVIKAKNAKFVAVKTVCIAKTQAMVRRTAFHNCCLFARSEGRRS